MQVLAHSGHLHEQNAFQGVDLFFLWLSVLAPVVVAAVWGVRAMRRRRGASP